MKKAANIILLVAKVLNLYSHFAIDDAFERFAPTLVFFFMLVCRMVVDWQFVNSSQQVMPAIFYLLKVDIKHGDSYTLYQCIDNEHPPSQAEPEEVPQTGSYDKLNLRPSLPRQAKNKKEQ